jgi:hypothetical protein
MIDPVVLGQITEMESKRIPSYHSEDVFYKSFGNGYLLALRIQFAQAIEALTLTARSLGTEAAGVAIIRHAPRSRKA